MAIINMQLDPTLEAVHSAIQDKGNAEPDRPYLGMSGIGNPCARKSWYDFHWCSDKHLDAVSYYRFDDGHRSEDIMAQRLRLVDGINLKTVDPLTAKQYGFSDIGGHFRGHADGFITGLLQAPKTEHVWEHKATNEKKQSKLDQLKNDLGEKQALKEWDIVYYEQAQLYMHYSKAKRHYLTCASPGSRSVTSARTAYCAEDFNQIRKKAESVITAEVPLDRINNNATFYQCKWCDHYGICHLGEIPRANCRTCAHSTAQLDGDGRWTCDAFRREINVTVQRSSESANKPCTRHLYRPGLLASCIPVDADQENNWVEYEYKDGDVFRNGQCDGCIPSHEIHAAGSMEGFIQMLAVKKSSAEPLSEPLRNLPLGSAPLSLAEDADSLALSHKAVLEPAWSMVPV